MHPDLLTTKQVAALVGRKVATVNKWAQEGKLTPAFRLPGNTGANLFRKEDVEKLLSPTGDAA